ncbi:MAG: UpxY family transcription antiterminator [Paraprevotella sp.]|nr:UpxY family transcription antiterminator [Paraprevotella sp.]
MDEKDVIDHSVSTATQGVGDAVGVLKKNWYVAIVNNNTEKSCGEKLRQEGHEIYVPIQKETHRWRNGKVKVVERVVISASVFVHCTEKERRQHVVTLPYVKRFMTDNARAADALGRHPVAVIPESQMEKLRFILYNSDAPVSIESCPVRLGDRVRVVRGKLRGIEGRVIRNGDGSAHLIVQLDVLGCARMDIAPEDLEVTGRHLSSTE